MEVKCKNCGNLFNKKPHQVKITKNNYCSRQCKANLMVKDNNKSFYDKCEKTESCWLWKYTKNAQGYGVAKYNGKNMLAHRVSFIICYGNIDGLKVKHLCGNRSCVNPAHLMA